MPERRRGAHRRADHQGEPVRHPQSLSFFNILLLVFAGVALFVGVFIIYNTFSIIVAQRQRENALLRAIGASRRQVLGSLLVESVVIGLVASVIGIVARHRSSPKLLEGLLSRSASTSRRAAWCCCPARSSCR